MTYTLNGKTVSYDTAWRNLNLTQQGIVTYLFFKAVANKWLIEELDIYEGMDGVDIAIYTVHKKKKHYNFDIYTYISNNEFFYGKVVILRNNELYDEFNYEMGDDYKFRVYEWK